MTDPILRALARDLSLPETSVAGVLRLLDEGNTVPFIARYRKEQTGSLDEVQIRAVEQQAAALRRLEERRAAILSSIEEQGALSPALREALLEARNLTRLEDLYAPFKPRRRTRGSKAREAGLLPLAEAIRRGGDIDRLAAKLVSAEFPDAEAAIRGAQDILAEDMSDDADARAFLRDRMREGGRLVSRRRRGAEEDPKYKLYLDFSAPLSRLRPHQVLAIRRGEEEGALSPSIDLDDERAISWLSRRFNRSGSPRGRELFDGAIRDAWKRLVQPALERDVRRELEDEADAHAIKVFSINLKNLLLQPPLPGRVVLGVDPGFRTGCKLAVVDPQGAVLETGQIYIHDARKDAAPAQLGRLVEKHGISVIAIGNGTASRETEAVVARTVASSKGDLRYAIVDEAGASVYSASDLARAELPDLDVSLRGAVSIARRLQDPLAELVKIDPRSIGVGMYQHDVDQARLTAALDAVVEDVVNHVGVALDSASEALLARVAGIGPTLARRIVEHRQLDGRFARRQDLLKVKGLGAKTFEQCAGFLRIRGGAEPLDRTGIHPERYPLARAILEAANLPLGAEALPARLRQLSQPLQALATRFAVGRPTLDDVLAALVRPGRDPREDIAPPILRKDVLGMEDLQPGMRLVGTVRNVVDFGAFVDIGVKQDGLIHVSEMAEHRVRDPHEIVAVGDRVEVVVLELDPKRGRIALSMKQA